MMVGNSYRVLYRLAVHHHLLLTSSVKPTTETIIIVVANTVLFHRELEFSPVVDHATVQCLAYNRRLARLGV